MICFSKNDVDISLPIKNPISLKLGRKFLQKYMIKLFLYESRTSIEKEDHIYSFPKHWRLTMSKPSGERVIIFDSDFFKCCRDNSDNKELSLKYALLKVLPNIIVSKAFKRLLKKYAKIISDNEPIYLTNHAIPMSISAMLEFLFSVVLDNKLVPAHDMHFMNKIGTTGNRPTFQVAELSQKNGQLFLFNYLFDEKSFHHLDKGGILPIYEKFIEFVLKEKSNYEIKKSKSAVQKVFAVIIYVYGELIKEINEVILDLKASSVTENKVYELSKEQTQKILRAIEHHVIFQLKSIVLGQMLKYLLTK